MSGVLLGFDFMAVDALARWLGLEASPGLLADLQILEAEALEILRQPAR